MVRRHEDSEYYTQEFRQKDIANSGLFRRFRVDVCEGLCPGILVAVPHGGRVEPRTERIGARIAARLGAAMYVFRACVTKAGLGQPDAGQHPFHIDSHCLRAPILECLLRRAQVCIAVHGMRCDDHSIKVGGRDSPLVEAVICALTGKGITATKGTGHLAACDVDNFVNRAGGGRGVQLEISRRLRCRTGQGATWTDIADAVHEALHSEGLIWACERHSATDQGEPTMPNITTYLQSLKPEITQVLSELIAFPSTVGNEKPVAEYLQARMSAFCDECDFVPNDNSIRQDPDYASPLKGLDYSDRPNVRVAMKGSGGGKALLMNTHMDVVPPSSMQEKPFEPQLRDGVLFGRGACDAKGQIATMYFLLKALHDLKPALAGDVIGHLVIEEEAGGNGTTTMVRKTGDTADAAIILEPSDFVVLPQVRGAVWFEATVYGQSGHSGKPGGTVSALLKAIKAIEVFTAYHDRCIAESRGPYPLFDQFENPAPLTIGQLEAGDWPAQAPQKCVFKGVLGILPDRTKEQVMQELREAIRDCGDEWLAGNFEIEFTYRHDANVISPDHPLVEAVGAAAVASGLERKVSAMTASCDAWMYNNQLGIPAVVFGPGSLSVAHSNQEQIAVDEVIKGIEVLYRFVCDWCA
jgi:acetylornithine deacetylase